MNDQTQPRPEHTPELFYQPSKMGALCRSVDKIQAEKERNKDTGRTHHAGR